MIAPPFVTGRSTGPDPIAAASSHALTQRTGHVFGEEPHGSPIFRPVPSWSAFERRIVTSTPSLPDARLRTSSATSLLRRSAPEKPTRRSARSRAPWRSSGRREDRAELLDDERRLLLGRDAETPADSLHDLLDWRSGAGRGVTGDLVRLGDRSECANDLRDLAAALRPIREVERDGALVGGERGQAARLAPRREAAPVRGVGASRP